MSEKADNINPAIIKKTQDTLGRIIQAPSLTDKLLNRPPVQFIQDIVKSVVKNTGFMKGLYSAEELEGAYIKASKENKLLFLKKLITIVGLVVGEQLSVKESKIAAGSEAEKTNELLQSLAKAINMKPDNDEYVKKTLKRLKTDTEEPPSKEADGRGSKEDKRERDRDRSRDDRKDREKDKDKDREERHRDKDRESKDRDKDKDKSEKRDKDKDREREKDKDREKSRDKEREPDKDKEKDKYKDREKSRDKEREKEKDREREKEKEKEKESSRHSREKKEADASEERSRRHSSSRGRKPAAGEDNDDANESLSKINKKESSSSKASSSKNDEREERSRRRDQDEDNVDNNDRSKRSGAHRGSRGSEQQNGDGDDNDDEKFDSNSQTRLRRPSSAKGGRKVATDENDEEEMAQQATAGQNDDFKNQLRPTTARPGAPRKRLTNDTEEVTQGPKVAQSSVIVDKDSDDDDDFVVKEQKLQDDQKLTLNGFGGSAGVDAADDDADDFDKTGKQHGALVKKILESKEQLENGSQLNNKKSESQKPSMQMDAQRKKERERIQKEIDKLKESIQTLTKSSIPLGRTLDFLQEDIDMMQKELIKWQDEYELHSKALKRQQQEANMALEPYKAALNDVTNSINDQLEKIASVKRKILLNEDKISKLIFNIGKRN